MKASDLCGRTQGKPSLSRTRSAVQRYGLAVLSVATALGLALLTEHYGFRSGQVALFVFALAIAAYYGGMGPAVLAVVLSITFFGYFFAEPRHAFFVRGSDLPYLFYFVCLSVLTACFGAARHRVERELLEVRDHFQLEVAVRTQQASLLDLTRDMIFVRDMNGLITYWNRGAQELYAFTPEQAIGKRSHELLRTVFPVPLDDIIAEIQRTGRWEGELRHTKADGTEVVVSSRWSLQRDEQGPFLTPSRYLLRA